MARDNVGAAFPAQTADAMVEAIRHAEGAGIPAVWLTTGAGPDAMTVFAAAAAAVAVIALDIPAKAGLAAGEAIGDAGFRVRSVDVKGVRHMDSKPVFQIALDQKSMAMPLVDVAALPDSAAVEDAVALVARRGFSRIPIYTERVDNVVGVVTAMDLLAAGCQSAGVRGLMRPATYVPESKRIDDLLREMQKARVQLAVVVDEYGGAVGIVTLEDIVEEVVGEIRDEHDRTPETVERLPDGSFRVVGRTAISELNEALDWDLPKGDFETVAGLVLATVHRIPSVGEVLRIGPYAVTVLEVDRRRILTVRITPPEAAGRGKR